MSLSRRDFLAGTAGLAAAAAFGEPSTQQPKIILGSGEHSYHCIHDWIKAPAGVSFGDTHGLAQDKAGRIYVAHTVNGNSFKKDALCVYDKNGRFITSWGEQFAGGAHGLDITLEDGTEYLYHCDTGRRLVVKTDLNGNEIWTAGVPKESGKYNNGEAFIPTNVAFGPDGTVFVADGYGSNWIHAYSRSGEYLRTFGGSGSDAGQLRQPHGLWWDNRKGFECLAIADRANRRIQYLDEQGKHVRFDTTGMRLPCHFSSYDGMLLVPDLESVVTVLDPQNKPIVHLGDGHPSSLRGAPRNQFIPGKFVHPHDAIFLQNGDILVAEWVPIGRVTLLKKMHEIEE